MGELVRLGERRRLYRSVHFSRVELQALLQVFSRHVAAKEWLDYSIDSGEKKAVFCVYRRAHDFPLYEIHKLAPGSRRSGDFLIVSKGDVIRASRSLDSVLRIFDPPLRAVP
ncbi:MAG: DUF2794 domain-containing protein [Pseudomonadota bacterium]|nr:DUF2794 domain-containing protein [Pseudomonadota bacterium]